MIAQNHSSTIYHVISVCMSEADTFVPLTPSKQLDSLSWDHKKYSAWFFDIQLTIWLVSFYTSKLKTKCKE